MCRFSEMIEAVLGKGLAWRSQRTNAQILRKISFLFRLLKQNFLLGSQGSTLSLKPMTEALSQHLPLEL